MQNEWTFGPAIDHFCDTGYEHRKVTGELCASAVIHNKITYTSKLYDEGEQCAWYGRFYNYRFNPLPVMAPCSNPLPVMVPCSN